MPSLGSNLLRPVELGSIDPHAMQNDGELTRDRYLGFAEPVALGEPNPPSLNGGLPTSAGPTDLPHVRLERRCHKDWRSIDVHLR